MIEKLLHERPGAVIGFIKNDLLGKWYAYTQQAISQTDHALTLADDLLAELSKPHWWIPDDLAHMAITMRPSLANMRTGIRNAVMIGSNELKKFVIELVGEDGYRVMQAATTAATAAGNKTRAHNERANLHPTKPVHPSKAKANPPPLPKAKTADHNTVGGQHRQDVVKGTGSHTYVTRHTLKDAIETQFNNALGILSEHIVDYYCAEHMGWGKDWSKHDEGEQGKWTHGKPSATITGKLNNRNKEQSLLRICDPARGTGIDSVWRVPAGCSNNGGKAYAIVEAKSSAPKAAPKTDKKPSVSGKLGVSGIGSSVEELLETEPPTNDTPSNASSSVRSGGRRNQGNNQPSLPSLPKSSKKTSQILVQMSHEWIMANIKKAVSDSISDEFSLKRSKIYSRHLVYTPMYLTCMTEHESALMEILGQSWPLQAPLERNHRNHEIPANYYHNDDEVKAAVNRKKAALTKKFGNLPSLKLED